MDIDIDLADRQMLLQHVTYVQASVLKEGEMIRHPTGVYFQKMPVDLRRGLAAVNYETAEDMGFFKIDLLNVHVYQNIKNHQHLEDLMNQEPVWELLKNREFVDQVIHINKHYDSIAAMPEPITSINHLAMFLAILRPAKKHLIGQLWADVEKTVWQKAEDGKFAFKRSHSVAYAHLAAVHMNLLCEQLLNPSD